MLRLPGFQLHRPATLQEATQLLADLGPEAVPVAGGTDLYPKMKRRQILPKHLVSLRRIPELHGFRGDPQAGLVIGAGCTLAEIAAHPMVRVGYPGLAQAVAVCSNPLLHQMGTLGGNLCLDTRCSYYDQTDLWREALGWCMKAPGKADPAQVPCRVAPGGGRCWAVFSSDGAPILIALGARVRLVGSTGERIVPLEELYRDDGIHYLNKAHDELVAEVLLPPANGVRSTYRKVRRRGSLDFAALGVAVALRLGADGVVQRCRIVLGGVASRPLVLEEAAGLLVGQRVEPQVLERVAEAVYRAVHPMDNVDFTVYYRRRIAPVQVRRALEALAA
ncbi:MAG: xanthine dehydrogenase family protein subunit M [Armatimonadota bacterium]|nr:xanthine dehydrogenase family protein subunit M [Armatimonadota bacterium]MDR7439447.1 xanthine dehydrogenase family protein subunit M [Armatimonadota bacterium]MDR7562910.1 xanthine dehydrogenase family protein subunit M [Armatimonadota bacterium]MDR7601452.1 xanthine dehydrogenase family protein subunit M [Armatimonadota bacterium]